MKNKDNRKSIEQLLKEFKPIKDPIRYGGFNSIEVPPLKKVQEAEKNGVTLTHELIHNRNTQEL